ncbi:MAG: biotin/lipoyl-binding protein [Candidatus Eisenbacteria bacterium]|nr:biotin/lipoyl-binding protein [Candidatus Eisenbacteria bacterium]
MKVWVTLDGHDAEVEFTTLGERLVLEVEGRKLDADFVRLPDGRVWSLLVDGRSYEVCVVGEEGGLRVTWQNQTVPVEARHPLEKMLSQQGAARAKTAGETVTAPMPGAVVAIRVRPGDPVHAGQAVVVLEAMKMQNELTAHADGVVSEVLVAEKAAVGAGQVLVRIKPGSAA